LTPLGEELVAWLKTFVAAVVADGAAQRIAHTRVAGVHVLRYTFRSHLAMRGAPARAIQELAGHADLTMTQRYMHLSPSATEEAIRLLDDRRVGVKTTPPRGGILEMRGVTSGSASAVTS